MTDEEFIALTLEACAELMPLDVAALRALDQWPLSVRREAALALFNSLTKPQQTAVAWRLDAASRLYEASEET